MNNTNIAYISEALVSQKFQWTESVVGENSQGPIKAMILEGEFQRAEKANRNKRVYSESLLQRETQKLNTFITEHHGLLMGLDHPLPGNTEQDMIKIQRMGLENSCAMCTSLGMDNKVVYGKAKVLEGDHGSGDKLASIVRAGFIPGVSSRGLGGQASYNIEGYIMVPESYQMVTFDIVSNPSNWNSLLSQQINEELMMFEAEQKQHTKHLWDVLIELKGKHL